MSSAFIRNIVERRAKRLAIHLGIKPEVLVESIDSYTIDGTILGDRTGTTVATACKGDATAAGDGTSGDHFALEPNVTEDNWVCLGLFNMNAQAETETWGVGDIYSGSEKVPRQEHDAGSSLSQRRVNALAFSAQHADKGMDSWPYTLVPAARKDQALKVSFFNIAAVSAEQTFTLIAYWCNVPGPYVPPGPAGVCRPCPTHSCER